MLAFPPFSPSFLAALRDGKDFVIIGHVSPDGDCISSERAMGKYLENLGKNVLLCNGGPFDRVEISQLKPLFSTSIPAEYLEKKPTVVIVDCSAPDRIGDTLRAQVAGLRIVVIDHHASGEKWGDEIYLVSESPSTTLLVQHLWEETGMEIDSETAKLLFFGFCTDTGFFKYISPGKGEALRLASRLVDLGADPNETFMRMNGGKSWDFMKKLGEIIDRAQLLLGGKVVYSYADVRENEDMPADPFYAHSLETGGVEAVIFLRREPDGSVRGALRSAHFSRIDVGAVATAFGGGGHRHASGFTAHGDLEEIKQKILSLMKPCLS